MEILKDEFDGLIDAVRDTLNNDRLSGIAQDAVDEQQDVAYQALLLLSPRATVETFVSTGHDDHTSIEDGWQLGDPVRGHMSAEAVIYNVSEHIQVQRFGTEKKNYPIDPGRVGTIFFPGGRQQEYRFSGPKLTFWLGPPLKWPVRVARFRKGGFVTMNRVIHPGITAHGGEDFVERAAQLAEPEMDQIFQHAAERMAFERLREFFS